MMIYRQKHMVCGCIVSGYRVTSDRNSRSKIRRILKQEQFLVSIMLTNHWK